MKRATNLTIGLIFLLMTACGQKQIETPERAMTKFEEFKLKEKFVEDAKLFYPGIGDLTIKPLLTKNINLVADDFRKIAEKGIATDKEYQDVIKIGLKKFSDVYSQLDTEDRERVCSYFEELMDIVGLESSDGHLNHFMYGFDPAKSQPADKGGE